MVMLRDEASDMKKAGLEGFVSIQELVATSCQSVPARPGVYVVLAKSGERPSFLAKSPAGRFKRKDPTVSRASLEKNWVRGARVLYFGKAGGPDSDATLQSRLLQFMKLGKGEPVGHWGGRLIWQIADSAGFVLCWKATPEEEPREVEKRLIREFVQRHLTLPFANLRD